MIVGAAISTVPRKTEQFTKRTITEVINFLESVGNRVARTQREIFEGIQRTMYDNP